jgi:glycosyltransferase involved in cell wall biosynthesis
MMPETTVISLPRKIRLAYLVTHPIQYQAPMLRLIAADPDIDLTVFFCSDLSVRNYQDEGFGRAIEWDVPLLDGYNHLFLPGLFNAEEPSVCKPLNWGLGTRLSNGDFDALWVHGHMRVYNLCAMINARMRGLVILNRDEAWEGGADRGPVKQFIKKLFYKVLRRIVHGYLYVGTPNRDYYLSQGMKPETLFPMPYAIDNDWFREQAEAAAPARDAFRTELGLEKDRPVILYASKFQDIKRPADLVAAFARIADSADARRPYLVMVGDGAERAALEAQVARLGIGDSVLFPGFQNQSALPRFYDLCDIFVLPSHRESWGLVINEAMAVGRAIVASSNMGCVEDLVRHGENGLLFPPGDIAALAKVLGRLAGDPELCRKMGAESLAIIEHWDFRADLAGLKQALAGAGKLEL